MRTYEKYGNILINRRVVVALCLFVSSLAVLICGQTVRADDTTYTGSTMYSVTIKTGYPKRMSITLMIIRRLLIIQARPLCILL